MLNLNDSSLFKQQAYVNGSWQSSQDGSRTSVFNPASGEPLGSIPNLGEAETVAAIEVADQAMLGWRERTAKDRAGILRQWFNLIEANKEDLAKIMTLEQGKPLFESRGEISYAASFIEWFAEEGKRVCGDVIPQTLTNNRLMVLQQPIGVCTAITPWNFPAAMITRKAAPALAAGCTIVVRPASETPFTALALAELAHRAGIPSGVFNIVTGAARVIGKVLTTHEKVAKFSFTGSTQVGRILAEQCASTIKKTSLELGGNAPFIVFEDANVDEAVEGAMIAKFRNAGQTCVCVNRFYIHDDVYDEFVSKFTARVAELRVGNGLEDGTQIGPLVNDSAVEGIQALISDAIDKGATVTLGGQLSEQGKRYLQPTIMTDIKPGMKLLEEEIFGPVATICRFKDEEEVIRLANNSIYGLASYFYSENIRKVWRVAEKLEYGMVGINTGMISNEVAPFGGVKQSGLGREGSKYGIEDYLEKKYLCLKI